MTTLEAYDLLIWFQCQIKVNADQIVGMAKQKEAEMLRLIGIEEHDREPGFNRFCHPSMPGVYFPSEREVIKELYRQHQAKCEKAGAIGIGCVANRAPNSRHP